MTQKLPSPFSIRTTVCRAQSSARVPSQKAAWISLTTITQFEGSGDFSRIVALCQAPKLSSRITDVPLNLLSLMWRTDPSTSSSPGTELSNSNRYSTTSML